MAGEEKELPELDPVRDNATADDFKTKNKVYELILYTGPELEQFPRAQRRLAEEIQAVFRRYSLPRNVRGLSARCPGRSLLQLRFSEYLRLIPPPFL